MTTTLIILSVVFSVLAHAFGAVSGYAKMICDLSEESKLNKTPYEYWHKHLSSKNNNMRIAILISIFSFVACTETRNSNTKNLTFAKDDYITLGELEMLTAKQNFKP